MSLEMGRTPVDSNRMSEFSVGLAMMLETVKESGLVLLCGRREVLDMPTTMSLKPLEHESHDGRLLPSVSITCGS